MNIRSIPTTMATQHPDNASKPYWLSKAFISTRAEIKECFLCFSDLGIDEYNWDWEGKFVDEAVVDRLLHQYYKYFKANLLGKNKFLTFRIPNPRVEKQFRLARAFMVMITSSQYSESLGFSNPPIFETILPLTEQAEEIIDIQEAFRQLIRIDHQLLKMEDSVGHIEVIPLFEQVAKIIDSGNIIKKYLSLHNKKFGFLPDYLRPYCARSDPALNSGLIPTMVALKIALSNYIDVEREIGVKLFPMVGTGTLPFRGGVSPDNIDDTLEEYAGFKTIIIQSAFRYDFPKSRVVAAISKLKKEIPNRKPVKLSSKQLQLALYAIPIFEKIYQMSIERLAPLINILSLQIPKRRERVQHIGLFGYSRGLGKIQLPRAIPFTAALYSLGIPPEIISTGRALKIAKKRGLWDNILVLYKNIKKDLIRAGYFLNKDNVFRIAKDLNGWYDIIDDIKSIESEFNIHLGPEKSAHKEHLEITKKIYEKIKLNKDISNLITYSGNLRKSLG